MYCGNCGKEVNQNAKICLACGADPAAPGKHCYNCASEVHTSASACPKCGAQLRGGAAVGVKAGDVIQGAKSPIVALLLNFCCGWLGIGYFYLGQWQKGLAIIGIMWVGWIVVAVISVITFGIGGILGIVFPIVWIASIIDAFMQADILNKGGMVSHWTFFGSKV